MIPFKGLKKTMPMLAKKLTSMPTVCMPLNAIWTSETCQESPQEFLELFFTASNNTEALMDELKGIKSTSSQPIVC